MLSPAKLRIIPYKDEGSMVESLAASFASSVGNQGFSGYTVQINPDSLNFSHNITYNQDQPAGTSGADQGYVKTAPTTLDFEVIFDRTGAVQSGDALGNELMLLSGQGVDNDINKLKKVILKYEGGIHRPKKVKIVWGKSFQIPGQLTFRGQLVNMTYSYKRFNSVGIPLRASVSLSFQGVMGDKLRAQIENNQSPDITHLITVKEGDTLPLIAYKIYGDSRYYITLMEANHLVHFRDLSPGQKIVCPPIE